MKFLFIIFIAIPLVEMFLLFEVSDQIGGLATISLVVLTAVIGVQVLKRQGLSTLLRANQRVEAGELPAQEIVEGMMLAAAGALLLTPGFITDTIGFTLLTAPFRKLIAAKLIQAGALKAMQSGSAGGGFTVWGQNGGSRAQGFYDSGTGDTVEGEFSEEGKIISRDETSPKE
ncbi:MAG: FxsA family protein [Pseudohongiellaceae bacterium]